MSAATTNNSGSPSGDEAMYVAVTRAWCRLVSPAARRGHPLGPYVFGQRFVRSIVKAQADVWLVALVCAKLACQYPWERDSGEPMPLLGPPIRPNDPLSTWWRALGEPDGLGVHYDELAAGVLEFLSVGGWRERPWG
ncbi:MAG: hypothetical protein ACRDK4_12190, partial [Solirubrobacteraceae bacterium]